MDATGEQSILQGVLRASLSKSFPLPPSFRQIIRITVGVDIASFIPWSSIRRLRGVRVLGMTLWIGEDAARSSSRGRMPIP